MVWENICLSARELKKPRTLTTVSLFTALGVLLHFITVIPNAFLKIGLNFTVTGAMGYLFGPVPALLGAVAIDLIAFVLRPTGPYFIGFTLNAALTGALYGLFLYRCPLKLWRVSIAKGAVSLVINVILSTVWLGVLYGKSIVALLPMRLVKNAVALPAEILVLWAVLVAVEKAWSRVRRT